MRSSLLKYLLFKRPLMWLVFLSASLFSAQGSDCQAGGTAPRLTVDSAGLVEVIPEEYPEALRNPLKGFRPYSNARADRNRFMTLAQHYVKWNELESRKGDDLLANIKVYSDKNWARSEREGVKVIPRVYLDWDEKKGNEYWPSDMEVGDYSSDQFKRRVVRLVEAMGECWDDDPRVAWVQMGIVGYWGEHHGPNPDAELQDLLGTAFEKAFTNKKVAVRHADEFEAFEFGIYWDSWAHHDQIDKKSHGAGIKNLNDTSGRWKTHPIEGEVAYNWGNYKIQAGEDPDDSLRDPVHRDFIIDTIRELHCTALGWISSYDQSDPEVMRGADAVQRALGYRFVVEKFAYTPVVAPDGVFSLNFTIKNTGSAPFYENWPVFVNFLDPETRQVVWREQLKDVDIRAWLPGDNWDRVSQVYQEAPASYSVSAAIALPEGAHLPHGPYIVALSIPDPAGWSPGVRLAVRNYFVGDFHPLGNFSYAVPAPSTYKIDPATFDDPML
jgi:hypothetical protein